MDPYSAVFNEHLDPSYLENDDEVPEFNLQYVPSINYYTFNSNKTPSEKKNESIPEAEGNDRETPAHTLSEPQQISHMDFLEDSFDFEISALQNSEFENLLNSFSEENLNRMAEETSKFKSRFVANNENERTTFIENRENQNTTRKMNSAVKTFQQYLFTVKSEFREIHTISPNELDQYLQEFFCGHKKRN